jgi:CBS domain-containing membrane protein
MVSVWYFIQFGRGIVSVGDFGLATSFGASAVLLYGIPQAPFAQPWNVVAGSTIFLALVGIFCREYLGWCSLAVQAALAVSLAIPAMVRSNTIISL